MPIRIPQSEPGGGAPSVAPAGATEPGAALAGVGRRIAEAAQNLGLSLAYRRERLQEAEERSAKEALEADEKAARERAAIQEAAERGEATAKFREMEVEQNAYVAQQLDPEAEEFPSFQDFVSGYDEILDSTADQIVGEDGFVQTPELKAQYQGQVRGMKSPEFRRALQVSYEAAQEKFDRRRLSRAVDVITGSPTPLAEPYGPRPPGELGVANIPDFFAIEASLDDIQSVKQGEGVTHEISALVDQALVDHIGTRLGQYASKPDQAIAFSRWMIENQGSLAGRVSDPSAQAKLAKLQLDAQEVFVSGLDRATNEDLVPDLAVASLAERGELESAAGAYVASRQSVLDSIAWAEKQGVIPADVAGAYRAAVTEQQGRAGSQISGYFRAREIDEGGSRANIFDQQTFADFGQYWPTVEKRLGALRVAGDAQGAAGEMRKIMNNYQGQLPTQVVDYLRRSFEGDPGFGGVMTASLLAPGLVGASVNPSVPIPPTSPQAILAEQARLVLPKLESALTPEQFRVGKMIATFALAAPPLTLADGTKVPDFTAAVTEAQRVERVRAARKDEPVTDSMLKSVEEKYLTWNAIGTSLGLNADLAKWGPGDRQVAQMYSDLFMANWSESRDSAAAQVITRGDVDRIAPVSPITGQRSFLDPSLYIPGAALMDDTGQLLKKMKNPPSRDRISYIPILDPTTPISVEGPSFYLVYVTPSASVPGVEGQGYFIGQSANGEITGSEGPGVSAVPLRYRATLEGSSWAKLQRAASLDAYDQKLNTVGTQFPESGFQDDPEAARQLARNTILHRLVGAGVTPIVGQVLNDFEWTVPAPQMLYREDPELVKLHDEAGGAAARKRMESTSSLYFDRPEVDAQRFRRNADLEVMRKITGSDNPWDVTTWDMDRVEKEVIRLEKLRIERLRRENTEAGRLRATRGAVP